MTNPLSEKVEELETEIAELKKNTRSIVVADIQLFCRDCVLEAPTTCGVCTLGQYKTEGV